MKTTNGQLLRWAMWFWLAPVIGLVSACSDMGSDLGGIGYTGYKHQILCPKAGLTSDEALEIGRRVLAKQGFRLKSLDKDQLRIETQPVEATMRGGEGRIRDSVVKVPNRVRRSATLEFSNRGEDLEAYCQVKMERLDTSDYRVFAQQRQSEDAPVETPIDREGATTARQNQVWSSAGRDESMEREILSEVHDRLVNLKAGKEAKQAPTSGESTK
jgi:hypothetical protein